MENGGRWDQGAGGTRGFGETRGPRGLGTPRGPGDTCVWREPGNRGHRRGLGTWMGTGRREGPGAHRPAAGEAVLTARGAVGGGAEGGRPERGAVGPARGSGRRPRTMGGWAQGPAAEPAGRAAAVGRARPKDTRNGRGRTGRAGPGQRPSAPAAGARPRPHCAPERPGPLCRGRRGPSGRPSAVCRGRANRRAARAAAPRAARPGPRPPTPGGGRRAGREVAPCVLRADQAT